MIQALEIDFKSTAPDVLQIRIRNGVAFFRHDLEGSLDSESVVDIHQLIAKIPAYSRLHIMSDDRSGSVTLWPEPDEWKPIHLEYLHCQHQESFEKHIDTAIDGPRRKRNVFPIAQIDLLKVFPK